MTLLQHCFIQARLSPIKHQQSPTVWLEIGKQMKYLFQMTLPGISLELSQKVELHNNVNLS
jgi:hypothetical protein